MRGDLDNILAEKDVEALIGADWLVYQDLDALIESVVYEESEVHGFDTSCFSGEYVTGDITSAYLRRIEVGRSDEAKQAEKDRFADPTSQANGKPDSSAGLS